MDLVQTTIAERCLVTGRLPSSFSPYPDIQILGEGELRTFHLVYVHCHLLHEH